MISIKVVLIIWFVYSLISTVLVLSLDRDTLTTFLATGPVGLVLFCILKLWYKIQTYFRYHYKKMSIWDDGNGNLYRAKPEMYQDIRYCKLSKGYKIVKRYATKSEWKDLPTFSDEFLKICLINCDRCIYIKECDKRRDH